jgi:hypothetical protein
LLQALNHRDISLTNILLSDQKWKNKPLSEVAFLADLDNADYYMPGGGSVGTTNTDGTLKREIGAAEDPKVEHLHRTVSPICHVTYTDIHVLLIREHYSTCPKRLSSRPQVSPSAAT